MCEEMATEMADNGILSLKQETVLLKDSIKLERMKYADTTLKEASAKISDVSLVAPLQSMKTRKTLKHHLKVIAFDWSPDQRHIYSGGEKGLTVIWDAFNSQEEIFIETDFECVFSCAYAPSTTLVACCGLSRRCSIYDVNCGVNFIKEPKKEFLLNSKYITHCVFVGSDQQILTAGANTKIALWDMERPDPVCEFVGHKSEVMGVSLMQQNSCSVFASCGNDRCVCIWDIRSGKCIRRIDDYSSELNAVEFYSTGEAVATAATDGTIRLFDFKADQEIMLYAKPTILLAASSLDFSKSGRILFAGYDDNTLRAWDVLKGEQLSVWYDHEDRISSVKVSPDGTAVGTCSWDSTVRIWA
ncbi:PREDICTED: guanine nucleotide-binding protein subunit beta-5-like [Amphimedon queenslandica]|uniref:Uncharacterized protein n=1 Tax=Amphimedon queenslandica TaxID=400682 RepID=A0A1X7VWS1_AMPQE|nr:PREDICTED: guanine nucleotide-binding protein subunit beta-5-like [Amphimedon queenslandica]|eukprot:XP_003382384.2 PREDICTED: guanine nucleotide-binding protein subunit beta-5-like [Amphimedon queenslandica]